MRFNETKVKAMPTETSYEGGAVYAKNSLEEWINMLFSDFMESNFYETHISRQKRFEELTNAVIKEFGAEFAAKAAIFARNELGMRSISQFVAARLNAENFNRKRDFFRGYPHRADDVAEIFAAIDKLQGKRSHACVRGFKDYLSGLDAYTLGKYKMNNRTYNMYDCINITHATSAAINDYKAGWLETPDTWEVAISTAANKESKNKEWKRLVEENKLGYMALIRNLRNILNCGEISSTWIQEYLVPQLINERAIRKSLVFPYQIYSAYKNMQIRNMDVAAALSAAFHIAIGNLPKLNGDTCIILDVSGSMDAPISARSQISIKEAGAVYAASIMLQNPNCDFVKFGNNAKAFKYNMLGNIFDIIDAMVANDDCGYGTDVVPAFELLSRHYDRIFLISDMQVMVPYNYWMRRHATADSIYKEYCKNYGQAELYSFDLGNYHTQISNPDNPHVHLCTALNEKVMKFISLLEDGDSLFDYINQVVF